MNLENYEHNDGGDLMEIHQFVKDIKDEIGKVIIGNENTVELILNALINEGHIHP